MTAFFISDPNLPKSGPPFLGHLGAASHPRLPSRFIFTLLVFLLYMPSPISVHAQSSSAEYQYEGCLHFPFCSTRRLAARRCRALPDRPLIFCVADENALNGFLEDTVRGKQIALHPVRVRHLLEKDNPRSCDLLFIVGQDKKRTAALLRAVSNAPTPAIGHLARRAFPNLFPGNA